MTTSAAPPQAEPYAVPLGYASRVQSVAPGRPVWRLSAAVVALLVGLGLLGLALYALAYLMESLTAPERATYASRVDDITVPLFGGFAAVSTLAGLVFLVTGLRWRGTVARAN